MRLHETAIPGCFVATLPRFADDRGDFTKVVQRSLLRQLQLPADFAEQFYSRSHRDVIRGLHLQLPPHEHFKLVHCLTGSALDVVVDLRTRSATYGEHVAIGLSAERPEAICVPIGCAHGFLAHEDDTLLGYWTTSEHAPESDSGIRWDSAGIAWPLDGDPVVSPRDAALPALGDFDSPFTS
jgi:dTDP-4-dehydrorhamnose 3,5-epimerase